MDKKALATEIRAIAERISDDDSLTDSPVYQDVNDATELLLVLARVLEERPLERAFGAPGDWGYGTTIGKALAA